MKTPKRKEPAASNEAKINKKATVAPRRADSTLKKGKANKNAKPSEKVPTPRPTAKGTRDGSKAAKILELLRAKDGATIDQLMAATEWQKHSVRGFLSGVVRKKMKLEIESVKTESGERRYSLKA